MRKARPALLVLCAALFTLVPPAVRAQATDSAAGGSARVIVKLKADSPLLRGQALVAGAERADRAQALGRRLGLAMRAGRALSERAQVLLAGGTTSAELARRLAREPDVEYAVPDHRRRRLAAPNDPLYGPGVGGNGPAVGQWYLRAPGGDVQSSLDIETAWSVTTGNPGVVVAVLDTGVRFDHPDLLSVAAGGKLLPGYDVIGDVDVANDGSGRDADASDPGDWVSAAEANDKAGRTTSARYSTRHGAVRLRRQLLARHAGRGGDRRDREQRRRHGRRGPRSRVLPVRVLGKCGGYDSDIITGMRWAAGLPVAGLPANPNRARVVNLSLGSESACTAAYRDAVAEVNAAGTVIVASAGNSSGHAVGSPANCAGVIAVAALRHAGTKVGFSDLGSEIAISAPGGNCVNTAAGTPCLYPILTTSDSGATVPAAPIYTDTYNASLGTSFSAPLVSGAAALVLSAQPSLTPLQVRLVLQSAARPFPTAGGDNGDGTVVPQCMAPQYDAAGKAVDQFQCYCTTDTCGAGMLDAGAAVRAAATGAAAAGVQAQGLWWSSPASSESGWGLNIAQQGNVIFATWFTYDAAGRAWWLSMTGTRAGASPDTYVGQLIETHGPAFSAVPFDANRVTRAVVGSGTLVFDDVNRGSFTYAVNGTQQTKAITRQVFGALPTCSYGAQPDFAAATNYQDLWWAAGGAESGWGVNLTHQGDNIFATWFTYDIGGAPLWLSVTAARTGAGVYSGQLIRTAGPPFSAAPFDSALVTRTVVGNATFTFANGSAATFDYTVNGVTQRKSLARELFAPPAGTVCR